MVFKLISIGGTFAIINVSRWCGIKLETPMDLIWLAFRYADSKKETTACSPKKEGTGAGLFFCCTNPASDIMPA